MSLNNYALSRLKGLQGCLATFEEMARERGHEQEAVRFETARLEAEAVERELRGKPAVTPVPSVWDEAS